ncbi:hypothetical protein HRbin36_00167 [bacterium HR36]|nr:hypothetical protein HRbin36_00167 [bacterium HR36]
MRLSRREWLVASGAVAVSYPSWAVQENKVGEDAIVSVFAPLDRKADCSTRTQEPVGRLSCLPGLAQSSVESPCGVAGRAPTGLQKARASAGL